MIKRKGLRLLALICAVLMFPCILTGAAQIPDPTNEFFVNDFADVISPSDEAEIMQSAVALYKATKAQVVVVTVNSLEGEDVNSYALNLGEKWGVGEKKTDTGVVLLLSVSDREVTIQVGYGLEGAINDAKAGRMLDNYAVPYLKNNDFSAGLKSVHKAIINEVYNEFGIEEKVDDDYLLPNEDEEEMTILDLVYFIAVLAIVIFVLIKNPGLLYFFALTSRNSRYSGGGFGGGFGSGGGLSGGGGFSGGGGSFGGGGSSRGF